MAKFSVEVTVRNYYDQSVILEVEADNTTDAEKEALKYYKDNRAELAFTKSVCLSSRPHPKVTGMSSEDAGNEEAPVVETLEA